MQLKNKYEHKNEKREHGRQLVGGFSANKLLVMLGHPWPILYGPLQRAVEISVNSASSASMLFRFRSEPWSEPRILLALCATSFFDQLGCESSYFLFLHRKTISIHVPWDIPPSEATSASPRSCLHYERLQVVRCSCSAVKPTCIPESPLRSGLWRPLRSSCSFISGNHPLKIWTIYRMQTMLFLFNVQFGAVQKLEAVQTCANLVHM